MKFSRLCIIVIFLSGFSLRLFSQVNVWTQRYDNTRLSWNRKEVVLNASNVDTSTFGLLFKRLVDDQIYAQPLIISNMHVNGGVHNVVFVATVNNTIYAFDAEDSSSTSPYWQTNLTPSGCRVINRADMTGACGGNYRDFSGNMGIVGTPVIDTNSSTMYVISRHYKFSTASFEQLFHAIDIFTGNERVGSPVIISAKCYGTGAGNVNDTINFDPWKQNQRPGLLLFDSTIYAGWASHCDWGPYHGWFIGFDPITLQIKHQYNSTPNGTQAGIWMSGAGPAVDDSGYIYLSTGNGTVGTTGNPNNRRNRGESVLKLIPSADTMLVVDFFTPSNYQYLENNDLDYGVDGVIIIPNSTLSLSGTKEGKVYLVDTRGMGRYSSTNDSVIQTLDVNVQNVQDKHLHGTPVYGHYYNNADTECVYIWAESDSIHQFFFDRNTMKFDTSLTIKGNTLLDYGMPGAMMSVSSNGTSAGSGIVWASHPLSGNANQALRPGRLDAYDARDVRNLLWHSEMKPDRDSVGTFAKFNTPVVANGKVYMATFSNQLDVYGLLPNTTGIIPPDKQGFLAGIRPNPAKDFITISYKGIRSAHQLELTITDSYGRKMMSQNLVSTPGDHEISITFPAGYESGLYNAVFTGDGVQLHAEKFVLQR